MPKRPTRRHILRDIRAILDWNQDELAKRIGSTASTVNKVENGLMPISQRLALRVFWATGVHWKDVVENRDGPPQTRYGPLHRSHLDRLEKQARELTDRQFQTMIGNSAYFMELLLRACREVAPYKLWALDAAILASFEELVEAFSLETAVERVKKEMAEETLKNPETRAQIEDLAAPLKVAINALISQVKLSPVPEPSKPPRQPVSSDSGSGS